jgi:hypothetical protein
MKEERIAPGISIIGFDSMEEILAYMNKEEQEAIDRTLPVQWEITWGDRVIRVIEDLAIFGHIFSEREFLAMNSKPGEAPDEETLYELDGLKTAHTAGYRYGIWHSEVEPDGEYGSAHVSTLWKITADEFTIAKRRGWKLTPELASRLRDEMEIAVHNHEGDEGA